MNNSLRSLTFPIAIWSPQTWIGFLGPSSLRPRRPVATQKTAGDVTVAVCPFVHGELRNP